MPGGSSIQLARVLGIRIGASPSWFLVLFLMVYLLSGSFGEDLAVGPTTAYLVAVGAAACFFASLVAHELGHALAARRFGIGVEGIDLWFFGGIAKLSRDTRSPREEFVVAAAGPLVTALIISACLLGGALTVGAERFTEAAAFSSGEDQGVALALTAWLAFVNVFLLVFNLVPAFPLDGGRIARAAAWRVTGDRGRATRASARAGQAFAILLMGGGVLITMTSDPINGLWLLVLGWFLFGGARSALLASDFSERLDGITAADLVHDDPASCKAAEDLLAARGPDARVDGRETLESLLSSEALRRLGALAVVDEQERLLGLLTVDRVRHALAAGLAYDGRANALP